VNNIISTIPLFLLIHKCRTLAGKLAEKLMPEVVARILLFQDSYH